MTYSTGGPIQAADYNDFVDAVNAIYADTNAGATSLVPASSGYGVVPNLPHVAIGDAVTAADWTAMFDRIHKCGTHQGTSVTPIPPAVSPGGLVVAYNDYLSGPTLSDVITDLTANRLNIDLSQITSDNTPPAQVSAITWTTGLQLTWQIDFGSWNNARYFFNTGGKVKFAGTLPGSFPSGSASKYWQDMLSDMGTVQFAWNSTIPSSGSGTSFGFYDLTTSYIEVYKKSTLIGLPAAYGNNYISVQAKLNAAAGTNGKIDFIIQLIDNDSTLPLETKPTGFTFNIGYFVSSGAIPYPGTKTFNPGTFTVVPNGGGGSPILTVGVSPTSLAQSIAGAGTATTSTVTATATGGTAPYTYAWSNSSGTVTFSAPTSAATTFSKVLANGESASGTAQVTVTDSLSATAFAPVPWAMNSNPINQTVVQGIAPGVISAGAVGVPIPAYDISYRVAYPDTISYYGSSTDSATPTVIYTQNSGSLPPGVSIVDTGSYWYLSGTPTAAGTYSVMRTVSGINSRNEPYSISGELLIYVAGPATLTTTDWTFPVGYEIQTYSPPRKTVCTSNYGITSGSVNSGSLPPGTSLLYNQGSNQDVIITGTPTTPGVYTFTLSVYSQTSYPTNTTSGTITITISSQPTVITGTRTLNASGQVGVTYVPGVTPNTVANLTTVNYFGSSTDYVTPTLNYSVNSGTMPPGVSIGYNSGSNEWQLQGTPTVAGTYNLNVTVYGINSRNEPYSSTGPLTITIT